MLETPRLRLHRWHDRHRDAFARMHADPEVMADLGGPITLAESDEKLSRYRLAETDFGTSRWAVEALDGRFLGYAGVMRRPDVTHPLGDHMEVGWRFERDAWDRGFATESARVALQHAAGHVGFENIVAYAGSDNLRSKAIIKKLRMVREPTRDFTTTGAGGRPWSGLVWRVSPAGWSA